MVFFSHNVYAYDPFHYLPLLPMPGFNKIDVKSDSATVIIPFTRAGNLILIKAKADTTEGSFILDTGAPGLVLNITYFRNYAASSLDGEQGGITGSVTGASRTMVKELSFAGITYGNIDADLIDLGHIESKKGVRILGLLGMQLFERFEMIIDYQKNELRLHLISHKEADSYESELLRDTATYTVIPIDLVKYKIVAHATVAHKKLLFIIDSGAETNVLDSRLPGKVLDHVTISQRRLLGGSGAAKVEALYGNISDISIGNQQISSMPILVTNLEQMCYSYNYCIDGMLGFDYLSLHKVGFNFVKRKMYIWK